MIKLDNVSKFYYTKGVIAVGFSKVNLEFKKGEFVAITGESGSGKSTLLNVISGLDTYEEGEMYVNGEETSHYTEKDFEDYRRKYIGNIFQNFNLVNSYTVYQNIALVMQLNGSKEKDIKKRVNELINKVGLSEYKNTKASKLSGGQKQRVAIARALAKDTPIIIADEPTGNLDSESAAGIIELLADIAKDKLVVIVTHNYDQVEPYVTRKIKMHDGKVLEDSEVNKREEIVDDSDNLEIGYKNIRFLQKLRLGIRNSFNIPVKFLILTFVFIFVSVSLIAELGSFQSEVYENSTAGQNYIFQNSSINRIVIKKLDENGNSLAFSDEDFEKISKIQNVDRVINQDTLVDYELYFVYGDYFSTFSAIASSIDYYKDITLDYGHMPENDDEIILIATNNNYYFNNDKESIEEFMSYEYSLHNNDDMKYKVVGIKILDASDDSLLQSQGLIVCGTDKFLDDALLLTNTSYSKNYITLGSAIKKEDETNYPMYTIKTSSNVKEGTAWVSTQYNANFPKTNKCIGETLTIDSENVFYNDSISLKIAGTYNKSNIKNFCKLDQYQTYNDVDGFIFVNPSDFVKLFKHNTYQISVFVTDDKIVSDTAKLIEELGYDTLCIKDTLYDDGTGVIIQIFSYLVTIGLSVVLLLISYFVIRIVLKSRNVYYSTVRMLGGNTGVCRDILIIDLFVDAAIAYAVALASIYLLSLKFPKQYIIASVIEFIGLPEYIVIFLIVALISLIISLRYSNRLFKKSTMVTIKEEV